MPRIASLEDLRQVREQTQQALKAREKTNAQIIVGMGTCGIAAGADESLSAILSELAKHKLNANVTGVGCIGMCTQEPLVDIVEPGKLRITYGHITADKVARLIEEHLIRGSVVSEWVVGQLPGIGQAHRDPLTARAIPYYQELPFYGKQVRWILRNCGFIDPESIDEYIARDGYAALGKVLTEMTPDQVIDIIKQSRLRGRGGAGFPTGLKWSFCQRSPGDVKYIIGNADEGDPGAFMNRSLLEGDPHAVIEGMIIGAYAIGAISGFIYCRAEYPLAIHRLHIAIAQARERGLLGESILGSGFSFDITLKEGAGAFVCGEETALMASIEGRRGMPRPRPPFPAQSGLWGKPTNINNVETWANVPLIILRGANWYSQFGSEKSKGTKTFALTGKIATPGLVEVPLGIPLGEIIFDIGGGISRDRQFKAVQTGGPSGGCLPVSQLNLPVDYESLTEAGSIMGSGGMVVMDEANCMVDIARFFLSFTQSESCGKCVPCRVGIKRMLEILERISQGQGQEGDLELLLELAETVKLGSLCGLGQTAPNPVLTTIRYFHHEYEAHIIDKRCPAGVCEALVPAPCRSTCPAEVNVPVYIRRILEGKLEEAVAVHREANPFVSVCGRVCPHFCERQCRRGEMDEPVAIRQLKRYMADEVADTSWWPEQAPAKDKKVAIVGGGPAGLTAALRLGLLGYQVTLFEALPVLGGMMAVGIPDYRLPRDVLNMEINAVLRAGNIKVKTNTRVGTDVTMAELREAHDAIYLAVGAHKSLRLDIPGENLEGVIHGVDFLRAMNLGEDISYVKGERIAVIGGGNVAIDVARSAIRLGASEVHLVYRRRREDMPAYVEEIEQTEEEGARMHFLLTPVEILGQNGQVSALRCQRMTLEQEFKGGVKRPVFDSSGRKRPFLIEAAQTLLEVDMVVPAIGQTTDSSFLDATCNVEVTRQGTIAADPRSFMTGEPGVFAGGDALLGPASIVEAVATGNKAAQVIDRYLHGETLLAPAELLRRPEGEKKLALTEEDGLRPRQKVDMLPVIERAGGFAEVEPAFANELAILEARRCLACDLEER